MDDQAAASAACWLGWCDGTAVPNPGKMAVGCVLRSPSGQEYAYAAPTGRTGCNNEAEALALLALLELCAQHAVPRLVVCSDSDVLVRLVRQPQVREAARLQPLFARIRQEITRFAAFELKWLPQHRNTAADALCREALGLKPRPAPKKTKRK